MEATLHSLLEHAAATASAHKGYRYLDRRERETFRSFADLADRARRIAAGLSRRGVGKGGVVGGVG